MNIQDAAREGRVYGRDMAQRQANRLRGLTSFFGPSELPLNAKRSALSESRTSRVSSVDFPQWEETFVSAYSEAYNAYVKEWEIKRAARLASYQSKEAVSNA